MFRKSNQRGMISTFLEASSAPSRPALRTGVLDNSRVYPSPALANEAVPAIDDEEVFVFPATAAQRRFWLLDQLVPGGNPALNIPLAVRLCGELDVRALERAINEIIRRHEALRTTFLCEKGRLLQVISPDRTMTLPLVEIADFPPHERARVPAHLMAEEARQPFDLASGPLLRARLVRVTPREHLLLFPTHHIVADGWSNGIFVRELGALYTAYVQQKPSPLPDLAIQFADFSQWQSGLLDSGGFEAQLDYWRTKLAGELPVLDLPIDHPRRPWRGQAARAEIRERRLSVALTATLKSLAVREGGSPFMVFLAVFAGLLNRYSEGQEDLLVATSTANRQRLEIEGLIGLFVNPLLLRLDLAGGITFRQLLARVRRVVLEAFENADAPFEKLVEELQPRRLQVNFLYQQDFVQDDRWPGIEVWPENAGSGGAVYEWNVIVLEDAAGVRLHCEYNAELFDAATVERMLGDYEGMLAAVVAEDGLELPIFGLPLASAPAPAPEQSTLHAETWRLPDETLAWMGDHLAPATPANPSCRQSLPGHCLGVLNRQFQAVPPGVPGALCVLTGDPAMPPLQTGDVAVRRMDGSIQWIGPSGSGRKINGLRVDCRRIEAALCAHPHVRRAAVLWHDNDQSEPLLTAYYEGDGAPDALVSAGQIRAFLQESLPEEWIPAAYVLLDHFPLTIDGRLQETALPAPVSRPVWNSADAHQTPYLALHHQIIEIWREILHVRSVGIRDDFFVLGGNSLLAMRMLYRLEQTCGKVLLPATLFRSATVEHLADEILKHDGEIGTREIVPLRTTGGKTPIFYLHGDISGGGFYCVKLSRDLGSEQPFYALPPVEVDDPLEDRPTIEGMAAAHVATIRAARPHGPYIIGGFCLGGVIAYEVARLLESQGETVEHLLVIDAGPQDRRLAMLRRGLERVGRWRGLDRNRQLYLFCRLYYLLARWDRFRRLGLRAQFSALFRRFRKWMRRDAPVATDPLASVQEEAPTAWFDARLDVPLVFLWALGGYRAGPYAGATTLLLSSDLIRGAEGGNPAPAWRRYVRKLEVMELAGDHLACITEHVSGLAATIRRTLGGLHNP